VGATMGGPLSEPGVGVDDATLPGDGALTEARGQRRGR